MVSIFDVKAQSLIKELATKLKETEEVKTPDWAKYVKTGASRERPPQQRDWWYIRTGAILRTTYKRGPIGTNKLKRKYGGKRNKGAEPEKFYPASGKVIRTILQQLEKAGLVELKEKEGREITPKGRSLLDKTATEILEKE